MMAEKQIDRMLTKLIRLENTLENRLFRVVDQVEMKWYLTEKRLYQIPEDSLFTEYEDGAPWGGADNFCWFKGTYTPGPELAGEKLYLYPKTTGYEAMLWVNGMPKGIYAAKFVVQSHGNHYCDMLVKNAEAGKPLEIALEYFAGNFCIGCQPLINEEKKDFKYHAGSMDVCVRDELYAEFFFDLKVVNQLAAVLDKNNFRRAELIRALIKVHELVYYSPEDVSEEMFREALKETLPYLKEVLSKKNSDSAPYAGLIGHSHMDTAWLWRMEETIKKCARTYANQLNLMEQYPEYKFVQSSAYHGEMVRRNYPELFEEIKKAVKEGRYEPNGGVWVESDCNIPTGEMMARQFVWGQRYTRKHFDYTSDTFWLPDTFGYNAAIPQIMKLSGVKYFLTTKMDWNDTNKFPYDSFWWRGIDGTEVLAHLNKTHVWPDPKSLMDHVVEGKEYDTGIKEKNVADKKLISFGFGDGGGGPQFEMLEIARRVEDLEGVPKGEYTTVSQFMGDLEASMSDPSTYGGELYLELHRGTLTNQHNIKRNNRLAEIALHNLEYLTVRKALQENIEASGEGINPLTETLLVNQFHDVLPGTCIPEVHERSLKETGNMILEAEKLSRNLFSKEAKNTVTISNTTSFSREDVLYLAGDQYLLGDLKQQKVTDINGVTKIAVSGIKLDAYASKSFVLEEGVSREKVENEAENAVFSLKGNQLNTPYAEITFDEQGYISSFKDKTAGGRELCDKKGYAFNTFLIAEDVPSDWDNWDIDADLFYKFKPVKQLVSRELLSMGEVELRIRSTYQLTTKSTLVQDMIFYADSPMVRFETLVDWNDHHRFLKAAFDTAICVNEVRHEIQFGHVKRTTTRNNDIEKAKFEVCAHKYSDISESRYGLALINDCKYGISTKDSSLHLSLHKGGNRPDYKGDLGTHYMEYALLPHNCGFSAEAVVKPAYLMNYKHVSIEGENELLGLLKMNTDHIIAETIKPCEDTQRAFIVRLYECEGATGDMVLTIPGAKEMVQTNLLEEHTSDVVCGEEISLCFRPFEIKTVKVIY
ncbi:glycosyl hydrolase-related protein [Lachnospiraceae bacterium OttesenSCG-928-D06]|nr:glycosyl hydrolase-related protein [Lachnospiraceae bacterium OttesenSCG-928-D06]